MTALNKIWAWWYSDTDRDNYPTIERKWDEDDPIKHQPWLSEIEMPPTQYIRVDEIASLQEELAAAQEAVTIRQVALEQRTAENERLQARLKACPTVEQLRELATVCRQRGELRAAFTLEETANRMEALNDR